MPAILPFLPLIIGGITAGVGAYDANNASIDQNAAQQANAKALTQEQTAAANQANLTKQEAVLGAQGQAQEQTGGSLTDAGTASITDLLAGYPGFQGGSVSGSGSTAQNGAGTASTSGSTPNIAAILQALQNGGRNSGSSLSGGFGSSGNSLSGGNWQTPPTPPQGQFELASSVLG